MPWIEVDHLASLGPAGTPKPNLTCAGLGEGVEAPNNEMITQRADHQQIKRKLYRSSAVGPSLAKPCPPAGSSLA